MAELDHGLALPSGTSAGVAKDNICGLVWGQAYIDKMWGKLRQWTLERTTYLPKTETETVHEASKCSSRVLVVAQESLAKTENRHSLADTVTVVNFQRTNGCFLCNSSPPNLQSHARHRCLTIGQITFLLRVATQNHTGISSAPRYASLRYRQSHREQLKPCIEVEALSDSAAIPFDHPISLPVLFYLRFMGLPPT